MNQIRDLIQRFARLHPVSKSIITIILVVFAFAMLMMNGANHRIEINEPYVAETVLFATKDILPDSTISSEDLKELTNFPIGDKYLGCDFVTLKKSKVVGLKAKRRITAGSIVTNEDLGTQSSRSHL